MSTNHSSYLTSLVNTFSHLSDQTKQAILHEQENFAAIAFLNLDTISDELCSLYAKKSRVRATTSGNAVGLKNDCSPRRYGVKGAKLPCGVWGETPPIKPNEVRAFLCSNSTTSSAIWATTTLIFIAFWTRWISCRSFR